MSMNGSSSKSALEVAPVSLTADGIVPVRTPLLSVEDTYLDLLPGPILLGTRLLCLFLAIILVFLAA